jgi:AraC family transcriptional activator FtrA
LAEAGLLDGKQATTHWKYAQELADRYPQVNVNPDVLYVDEGQIITSAGSAAGIDMGLHLIRRDFGSARANAVARRLVVPPSRAGGQKQFICTPVAADSQADAMTKLLDDLRATLSKGHTIDSMAKRVHLSKRTFARRFKSSTGMTPHCWLQAERVRYAQELLESSKLSLTRVAQKSGFSDPQLLRLHFKRVVGTSPTRYRQSFS